MALIAEDAVDALSDLINVQPEGVTLVGIVVFAFCGLSYNIAISPAAADETIEIVCSVDVEDPTQVREILEDALEDIEESIC